MKSPNKFAHFFHTKCSIFPLKNELIFIFPNFNYQAKKFSLIMLGSRSEGGIGIFTLINGLCDGPGGVGLSAIGSEFAVPLVASGLIIETIREEIGRAWAISVI
jgi:hypothetical protein